MTLVDDKRNGEYSKWDKEGELLHKGNFKDDKEIEVIYEKDESIVINVVDINTDNGTSEVQHTTTFQSNKNDITINYNDRSKCIFYFLNL